MGKCTFCERKHAHKKCPCGVRYCDATCQRAHWYQAHCLECRHKWKQTLGDYVDSLHAPPDNVTRRAIHFAIGVNSRRNVSEDELRELLDNRAELVVADMPFLDIIDVFANEYSPWWESAQSTGVNCKRVVLVLSLDTLPDTREQFADAMKHLSMQDESFWEERNFRVPILMDFCTVAVERSPHLSAHVTADNIYDGIRQLRGILQRSVAYHAQVTEEMVRFRTFVTYANKHRMKVKATK